MIDERYDRDLRHARDGLTSDLLLLGQAIGDAFRAMNAIQFDAPWKDKPTTVRKGGAHLA